MQHAQMHRLVEAIYDTTVDRSSWQDVMELLKLRFGSQAEAFYFLDFNNRDIGKVFVRGIERPYHAFFEDMFYTPDNPWTRCAPLHRPGVVRTVDRMLTYFRDGDVLSKSQYYNEWMKPQNVANTIGSTLLSEDDVLANITLLRPEKAGPYCARDIADFGQLCGHLQRALQIARRLDGALTQQGASKEALDRLRFGAVFLDPTGHVVHANAVAEALLRRGDGISLKRGRLTALDYGAQRKLDALLSRLAQGPAMAGSAPPSYIALPRGEDARPLLVSALRLSARRSMFGPMAAQPTILLLLNDRTTAAAPDMGVVKRLYQLTPAETRLAQALLSGHGVRQAADKAGLTYETARWYLKILYQKTDTNRQAELVGRLMADLALSARTAIEGDGLPH